MRVLFTSVNNPAKHTKEQCKTNHETDGEEILRQHVDNGVGARVK